MTDRARLVDDLRAMIRLPSITGSEDVPIAQVEDCARVLAAWLRRELLP